MTALEALLSAIDAMRAACDRGSTCYEGCEAEHPRCAVYRAAEALRKGCRWESCDECEAFHTGCWESYSVGDGTLGESGYIHCPACGGRIVEVTDGD